MTENLPPSDETGDAEACLLREPPPNFDSFPCSGEADVQELMESALPCRCGSRRLLPVSDLGYPPTLAIACLACEAIEGDAGTLAAAIRNWNVWTQTPPGRHAWVPTETDEGEVCCLCGAYPDSPEGRGPCIDDPVIPPDAQPPDETAG